MTSSLIDRRQFPTLDTQRYLNQASLGLIGEPAVQAMHRFIDDTARHGNGRMSDEDEARFLDAMRARAVMARARGAAQADLDELRAHVDALAEMTS